MSRRDTVITALKSERWVYYLAALILLVVVEAISFANLSTTSLATGGLVRLVRLAPETFGADHASAVQWFSPDLYAVLRTVALLGAIGCALVLLGRKRWVRFLLIAYICLVEIELVSIVLIIFLSLWNPAGHSILYLNDAATVWVLNILVSGILYWALDMERQAERNEDPRVRAHFRFPQEEMQDEAWRGWVPGVVDYLFLSFCTATALSPTDTDCLSVPAKVMVALQSIVSLSVVIMVVARAVNII